MRRKPAAPAKQTSIIQENSVQKTARYPTMRASGDPLSAYLDPAVLDSETTAVIVNPIDVPSCEQVLNIAPPRACVFVGKTAEMTSRPTVKRTSGHKGWRTCVKLISKWDRIVAESCRSDGSCLLCLGENNMLNLLSLLTCAMNAMSQYGHLELMLAIRSGEMLDNIEAISTTHMTGMRLTKKPVERLVKTAVIRAGRMRSDAPSAVLPWTC